MQAFREWLRSALDERQWSNSDLERASGVSNSIIWYWLADSPRRPSPANLQKIAPALGVPYEDLMRLCGYLPGDLLAEVSARRQLVRDQLDEWMTAVGEEYEQEFWDYLKRQGDSTVTLFQRIKTAVNTGTESAVNDAVSTRRRRGRKRGRNGNGPLTPHQHAPSEVLTGAQIHRHQRQAA